jgi:hypothetical protein
LETEALTALVAAAESRSRNADAPSLAATRWIEKRRVSQVQIRLLMCNRDRRRARLGIAAVREPQVNRGSLPA